MRKKHICNGKSRLINQLTSIFSSVTLKITTSTTQPSLNYLYFTGFDSIINMLYDKCSDMIKIIITLGETWNGTISQFRDFRSQTVTQSLKKHYLTSLPLRTVLSAHYFDLRSLYPCQFGRLVVRYLVASSPYTYDYFFVSSLVSLLPTFA